MMRLYAVRMIEDKQAVGFYFVRSVDHLADAVDEVADTHLCEYQEVFTGGFYAAVVWEGEAHAIGVERHVDGNARAERELNELHRTTSLRGQFEPYIDRESEEAWYRLETVVAFPTGRKTTYKELARRRREAETEARERALAEADEFSDNTVYFVGYGSYVKIGVTNGDGTKRIKSLSTACPEELTVYAIIKNAPGDLEFSLHKRFAAHRLRGEWFDLCDEIKAYIAEVGASQEAG